MPRARSSSLPPADQIHMPDQPLAWVNRIVVAQWGRTNAEAFEWVCMQAFPFAKVYPCATGAETLTELRTRTADLLLLGMSLPDIDGGDLLHCVTQERLATRVLVASHRRDEQCLRTLRDARFDGLIDTQEESVTTLIKTLRLVAAGAVYVSPTFRRNVVDRSPMSLVWQKLTPAELRVFAAIGDGSGNQEAADKLGLSKTTVQTHRRNLMQKIGISSSAKLVFEAVRLGVVRVTAEGGVIRPGFEKSCVRPL